MGTAKKLIVPATLAVAGVKASEMIGFGKTWQQIAGAIVGAGLGLWVASAVAGKSA